MIHKYFVLRRNSYKLTVLIVGVVFLITTFPVFAQFQPRDRKPASGYARASGSGSNLRLGVAPASKLKPQARKLPKENYRLVFENNLWTSSSFKPYARKLPKEHSRAASGSGGNIQINSQGIFGIESRSNSSFRPYARKLPKEHSRAAAGNCGNIQINSQGIFGIESRSNSSFRPYARKLPKERSRAAAGSR